MGQIYNNIKKQLSTINYNPDLDTLTVSIDPKGVAELGAPTFMDRIFNQQSENLARSIHPVFSHAIIYKDTGGEIRYFDIETPLIKEGNRWVRHQPIVACIDFNHESSS